MLVTRTGNTGSTVLTGWPEVNHALAKRSTRLLYLPVAWTSILREGVKGMWSQKRRWKSRGLIILIGCNNRKTRWKSGFRRKTKVCVFHWHLIFRCDNKVEEVFSTCLSTLSLKRECYCKKLSTWMAALYFYFLAWGLPVEWRLVCWHLDQNNKKVCDYRWQHPIHPHLLAICRPSHKNTLLPSR